MEIQKQIFGLTRNNKKIYLFTLSNDNGMTAKITNYGGIITGIFIPDKNGKTKNVVLGFDWLEDYLSEKYISDGPYFGAIIGRVTNRIAGGRFTIDGTEYRIRAKNQLYSLHGGIEGLDKKCWKAETKTDGNEVSLVLRYLSRDMEEGYPGNLAVTVTYTLDNDNMLTIDYTARTDKKTHVNLTNHTYFNLTACREDVLNHEVVIHADHYTETDENFIPTGKILSVRGTQLDFCGKHRIGERIHLQKHGKGYDHNFVLNDYTGQIRKAAEVTEAVSGRKLRVFTTEPGMQLYTGNYLDGTFSNRDIVFSKWMGVCFETQHFPDSPNHLKFPSTLLCPGETFNSTTIWEFSVVDKKIFPVKK